MAGNGETHQATIIVGDEHDAFVKLYGILHSAGVFSGSDGGRSADDTCNEARVKVSCDRNRLGQLLKGTEFRIKEGYRTEDERV